MKKFVIDTHTHIQEEKFLDKIKDVVDRAISNKVEKMITMGVDFKSSQLAIKIAKENKGVYAGVGIHPCDLKGENVFDIEKLIIENKKNIKAIGEIGLDLHYDDNPSIEEQIVFLKKQFDLAVKYNLPVSIHIRDAYDQFLEVMKQYNGKLRGVFHCFTLNYEKGMEIINLGLSLGIGGILTYKSAKDLREAVKKLPLDKLVFETDAPYLAPVPHRSSENEPAYLIEVAKEMANLRNISLEDVIGKTYDNAMKIFKL